MASAWRGVRTILLVLGGRRGTYSPLEALLGPATVNLPKTTSSGRIMLLGLADDVSLALAMSFGEILN